MFTFICSPAYVYLHMCPSKCLPPYAYFYIYIYLHIFTNICYLHMFTTMHMFTCKCLPPYVSLHIFTTICLPAYVSLHMLTYFKHICKASIWVIVCTGEFLKYCRRKNSLESVSLPTKATFTCCMFFAAGKGSILFAKCFFSQYHTVNPAFSLLFPLWDIQ